MFVFGVGTIDKGAAVSVLSQFPDEEEVLLPPLSWIEVTGDPYLEQTEKGDVMMIPARVNCNLKSRTIEEIISRRRQELLSMRDSLFQVQLEKTKQIIDLLGDRPDRLSNARTHTHAQAGAGEELAGF
jgi:hypothetical protein